jgi:maleate cis-trans isomerase
MSKSIKIGLIVPKPNQTMQPELTAWFPKGSSVDVKRIPGLGRGHMGPADIPEYSASVVALSTEIAPEIDRVVYGCTSGAFLGGAVAEDVVLDKLSQSTGKPSISTARAVTQAFQASGSKRIAVLSPYSPATNVHLISYLKGFGIDVAKTTVMDVASVGGYRKITPEDVVIAARDAMTDDADGLLIVCSLMPTFPVIGQLQTELGRPVFSSISATAREVMDSMGMQITYVM